MSQVIILKTNQQIFEEQLNYQKYQIDKLDIKIG